ncbi:MAG: hypothetical protein SV375_04375 [Thermodesulfobacteriota bacterium]|nr:hypothetical protein [Thermodesulfobacteriota bacterium]
MQSKGFALTCEGGTRLGEGYQAMGVFRIGACTTDMGSTKCRQQRVGRRRMPDGEEHRKAVCGKTARTV